MMNRFSKEVQQEVVKKILSGELFLEQAMVEYGVTDKRTISRWVKKHLAKVRKIHNNS